MRQPLRSANLRVHAEQLAGEERRLVAAGAGADFEDDVLLVVRVLRYEQNLQLGDQGVAPRVQRLELFLRQLAHVGVARRGELFGAADVVGDAPVFTVFLDQRLDVGQRLGELPVLGGVALHFARAEAGHQLFVALFFCREFVEHQTLSQHLVMVTIP